MAPEQSPGMAQEGSSGAWGWQAHGSWGEMGTWTIQGHAKPTCLKQSFALQGVSLSGRWEVCGLHEWVSHSWG